jgi:hypothetical protein
MQDSYWTHILPTRISTDETVREKSQDTSTEHIRTYTTNTPAQFPRGEIPSEAREFVTSRVGGRGVGGIWSHG